MGRDTGRLLSALNRVGCPICLEGADSLLGDGARAGALALTIVTVVVLAGLGRFAWRLIKAERAS